MHSDQCARRGEMTLGKWVTRTDEGVHLELVEMVDGSTTQKFDAVLEDGDAQALGRSLMANAPTDKALDIRFEYGEHSVLQGMSIRQGDGMLMLSMVEVGQLTSEIAKRIPIEDTRKAAIQEISDGMQSYVVERLNDPHGHPWRNLWSLFRHPKIVRAATIALVWCHGEPMGIDIREYVQDAKKARPEMEAKRQKRLEQERRMTARIKLKQLKKQMKEAEAILDDEEESK